MKNYIALLFVALFFAGCGDSAAPVSEQSSQTAASPASGKDLETVTAHSADRSEKGPMTQGAPDSSGGSSWSRGGEPIDTTKFDAEIAAAEKALAAAPSSSDAKKALSEAFYKRGAALTEARQYAAALGDYRRALKHDPSNADAKRWIEQIIVIYEGLNKGYPKEGEEPAPLPFKSEGA